MSAQCTVVCGNGNKYCGATRSPLRLDGRHASLYTWKHEEANVLAFSRYGPHAMLMLSATTKRRGSSSGSSLSVPALALVLTCPVHVVGKQLAPVSTVRPPAATPAEHRSHRRTGAASWTWSPRRSNAGPLAAIALALALARWRVKNRVTALCKARAAFIVIDLRLAFCLMRQRQRLGAVDDCCYPVAKPRKTPQISYCPRHAAVGRTTGHPCIVGHLCMTPKRPATFSCHVTSKALDGCARR